jgi:hypothetical protein
MGLLQFGNGPGEAATDCEAIGESQEKRELPKLGHCDSPEIGTPL